VVVVLIGNASMDRFDKNDVTDDSLDVPLADERRLVLVELERFSILLSCTFGSR
jgi:hypothetical protein